MMQLAKISALIGLTISVGPAITAHLLPRLSMLDQLGAVVLGLLIGMQAASRSGSRHGRTSRAGRISAAAEKGDRRSPV